MQPVLALSAFLLAAAPLSAQTPALQVTPVHYELTAALDFRDDTLQGTARITVQNNSPSPAREIPLVLYRLMEVRSARGGDGDTLAFTQRIVRDPDLPALQLNEVRVALPASLAPGARTTITVQYGGFLLGYAETGMGYIKDRIDPAFTILRNDAWAFPLVMYASLTSLRSSALPSFDYVARITVPDTLVVANGGRLVERTARNGEATYVYRSIKPSWRMDFAIGHYGELQAGPVRILYLRSDSAGAARVARAVQRSLELFRSWFGPLSGDPALTILELEDGFGSQTDVTTIIQAAASFRDSTRNFEIYHEVSHLWNPPETDNPGPRWNEGLAEFLQYLAAERLDGGRMVEPRATRLLEWLKAHAADNQKWQQVPLVDYGRAQMTDLSYRMGGLFFYLLYHRVGGDAFNRIVGGFSREYAGTGASSRDFVRYAEGHSPADLRPLFQDWFLTTNWVASVRAAETPQDLIRRYGGK